MVLRLITFGFIISFLTACGGESKTNVLGVNANDNVGKKLYSKYCKVCHGKNGDAQRAKSFDLTVSTLSDAEIRKVILYGNEKGMMGYKKIIKKKEEIDSLISHVKTFRK